MMRARFSDLVVQVSAATAARLVYPGARSRVNMYLMPGMQFLQISHLGSRTDVSSLSPFGELGLSVGIEDTLALPAGGGAEYDVQLAPGRVSRGFWSGLFGGRYLPHE